jgi:hypothetical protein
MPRKDKYTKELSLGKKAAFSGMPWASKTANYNIGALTDSESGFTYVATGNVTKEIKFTLPLANACNGEFWNFVAMNCAKMIITGAKTNSIVIPGISVNAVHGISAINCGTSGNRFGRIVGVHSDGSYYYAQQIGPAANANALFYNGLFED